jgi:hypothetical protein
MQACRIQGVNIQEEKEIISQKIGIHACIISNTKTLLGLDAYQAGKHHDYDFNTHNNEAIKN